MSIQSLLLRMRKREFQNSHKKTKHTILTFQKTNISYPWYTYMSDFMKAWSPDFFKNMIKRSLSLEIYKMPP